MVWHVIATNFSSSSFGNETEEIFYEQGCEFLGCWPYKENLEPLAIAEEAAE